MSYENHHLKVYQSVTKILYFLSQNFCIMTCGIPRCVILTFSHLGLVSSEIKEVMGLTQYIPQSTELAYLFPWHH